MWTIAVALPLLVGGMWWRSQTHGDALLASVAGRGLLVGWHADRLWLAYADDARFADGRAVAFVSGRRPESEWMPNPHHFGGQVRAPDPMPRLRAVGEDTLARGDPLSRLDLEFAGAESSRHGAIVQARLWVLLDVACCLPLMLGAWQTVAWWRRRQSPDACRHCGYALAATRAAGITRCPECGQDATEHSPYH